MLQIRYIVFLLSWGILFLRLFWSVISLVVRLVFWGFIFLKVQVHVPWSPWSWCTDCILGCLRVDISCRIVHIRSYSFPISSWADVVWLCTVGCFFSFLFFCYIKKPPDILTSWWLPIIQYPWHTAFISTTRVIFKLDGVFVGCEDVIFVGRVINCFLFTSPLFSFALLFLLIVSGLRFGIGRLRSCYWMRSVLLLVPIGLLCLEILFVGTLPGEHGLK